MCKINPRVDFAFKKLFGSEENKDLLISLINDYRAGKMSILDIKAKAENGRWFNVEMQISEDYNFDKRAIYYWAKLVTEQLSEGMMFKELKKTISINILDFNFIPNTPEVHNCYKIINTATGKDDTLHDIFELHYIELKKFKKSYHQINSALDRWSTFLTKADKLDKEHVPKELASDKTIVKAIEAVDRMFNEEERLVYETRMQSLADVESKIASADEKGVEKGLEQGREEGINKAPKTIALNLLGKGIDISTIAEVTGLTESVIEAFLTNREK